MSCRDALGIERPAPAHTPQSVLSRFISGSRADLGVYALLPMAPDAWRDFSRSQCEGGCTGLSL